MNTSRYVQELEDIYCHSRSVVTSEAELSSCSVNLPMRIINGGKKILYTAAMTGMLLNNTVPAYANLIVSAGETSTGLTVGIETGNSVVSTLDNYGTTISTTINSGGTENIYDGGSSINATINSNGSQVILQDGLATNTTLEEGHQRISGGSATDTNINGGFQYVSGGVVTNTTINGNGSQYLVSSASATSTTINDNSIQEVQSGAIAEDTTINNNGSQYVVNGSAINTTINDNGLQIVHYYGSVINTSLNDSAVQYVYGGGTVNSTIVNGGTQYIEDNGLATNTIINGGVQLVYGTGSAVNTIIESGHQDVYNGGTAISTTINGATYQYVYDSGYASGTIINSSSYQYVYSGGYASDTTINSASYQHVYSANVSDTYIDGGYQYIYEDGSATNTFIDSAGRQYINSGGSAMNTDITSYGRQYIYDNASATSTTIGNSATQYVYEGGNAITTIVNSGGEQRILLGGSSIDTTVNSGGLQTVWGSATSITVASGGTQVISLGGTATDTIVDNGGYQQIEHGSAVNTTINSGQQYIGSTGVSLNTSNNGGTVILASGGYLEDYTNTGANGTLQIADSNTLQGTTALDNGNLIFNHEGNSPFSVGFKNLSANNANISMGVNLEDQTADQISITGTYTGNSILTLTNLGNTANQTTGDSILLIDFDSANTGGGTFSLRGGKWDEGAYIYKLFQNENDPDYYLRSTGELTDTFKTMLNIPSLNAVMARTGMNSLNKRMGELHDMNNPNKKQGVWSRIYYKDMTVDDLIKTDMSLFGVEAGYDWLFKADEPTKLYAGVMIGYLQSDSIKTKNSSGNNNNGKGNAPSIGIYATMTNEKGWFIDLAARNFWTKIENTVHTASDTFLNFDVKRNLFTTSLEVGKNIDIETDFKLQPKAEISYMNANKDSTPVTNGVGNLTYDSVNYFAGKAAIMFTYTKEMNSKLLIQPLLELAYNQEFAGRGKVRYDGATAKTSLNGGSFEIATGINMQLADNLYWHALGTYESGNKISGWGLNAGVRISFGGNNANAKKENK